MGIWDRVADHVYPEGERYLADPVAWAKERAGIHLWSKQREVIESVRDNPETVVHSCHNVGKSLGAAVACCWWLDTHPPGSAFVVTTAPSGAQVKAVLWREIGRIHKKAELSGRTNLSEWYIGNELVAYGRKPSEYSPTSFQGIHAEFVLVILDEACGIPKSLWDAASSLTSNAGSRTLAIGNPDDPHSEFARNCEADSGWNVIHIGWEHTPNRTGEAVPKSVAASLISTSWVRSRLKRWGAGSPLFVSKVKGLFPVDSDKGVIPWSWAVGCKYLQLPEGGKRCAGLDVGGGGDQTVLRERVGSIAGRERLWQESDPMKVCGEIATQLHEWGTERVVVDVVGIGWALAGRLQELSSRHNPRSTETTHAAEVVLFQAAERSNKPEQFDNKRAEMHWNGRELSRLQMWDLGEVDDDCMAELCESEYVITDSKGKVRVEKKADVIKRLGHSPDRADALLMAYWEGDSIMATLPATAEEIAKASGAHGQTVDWAGPTKPTGPKPAKTPEREQEDRLMRQLMARR